MSNLVYVNTGTAGLSDRPAFDPEDMLGINSLVWWNSPTLGNSSLQTNGQFSRIMSIVGPDLRPVRQNEDQEEPLFRSYREGVAGCALYRGSEPQNHVAMMATATDQSLPSDFGDTDTYTYAFAFVDRDLTRTGILMSGNGYGNSDLWPYFRTGGASAFSYHFDFSGGPSFQVPKINDEDSWQWAIVSKTPAKLQCATPAGENITNDTFTSTLGRMLIASPSDTASDVSPSLFDGYLGDGFLFNEDLFAAGNATKLATLKTYMHAITGRASFS